jgi:hypothetical protein
LDVAADGSERWLSYSKLAEALGISRESAGQLTIRKRWGRRRGNDKRTRVGVPVSALPGLSLRTDGGTSLGTHSEASALRVKLAEVEAELWAKLADVEAERRRCDELLRRCDELLRRCDELRGERAGWRAQALALRLPSARWRWWRQR